MKSITEIKEALERLRGEAFLQGEMSAKEEATINDDIATLQDGIEELKGLRELRKTNDELRGKLAEFEAMAEAIKSRILPDTTTPVAEIPNALETEWLRLIDERDSAQGKAIAISQTY